MSNSNGTAPAQAVAKFTPPRLPWADVIAERFGDLGVTKTTWAPLVEAVFPTAKTTQAVVMALSYCRARKLDPFKRPVNIVPMYDAKAKRYVETVWPSITEHRITAHRTGQYAGKDRIVWGPLVTHTFKGVVKDWDSGGETEKQITVTFPEYGVLTVYRLVGGQRVAFTGPEVYWMEAYARAGKGELPNSMWTTRPRGQFEKCIEAAALRVAFPEECGEPVAEEMEGRTIEGDGPVIDGVALASSHADIPSPGARRNDAHHAPPMGAAATERSAPSSPPPSPAPPRAPAESLDKRLRAALAAATDEAGLIAAWDTLAAEIEAAPDDMGERCQDIFDARHQEIAGG